MPRLYLVRRSIEHFIGPLTVDELVSAYKRMEFGLQDEVGGHCGKWVCLDDPEQLKRHYAELAEVVREKMLGGWGVSEHGETALGKTKSSNLKKNPKSKKNPAVPIIVVLLVVGIGATVLVHPQLRHAAGHVMARLFHQPKNKVVEEFDFLLQQGDVSRLIGSIDRNLPELVQKAKKNRVNYDRWIPYLRFYAFYRGPEHMGRGEIDGLRPILLRGIKALPGAPPSCSIPFWKRQIVNMQEDWQGFINGAKLPKRNWFGRMLVWDMTWINRRKPQPGWLKKGPDNYYEACLSMARVAFSEIVAAKPEQQLWFEDAVANEIAQRLTWLASLAHSSTEVQIPNFTLPVMGKLTCYEAAMSSVNIERCASKLEGLENWEPYLERRRAIAELRLVLRDAWSNKRILPQASQTKISAVSVNLKDPDPLSQFDYAEELQLVRRILRDNGELEKAFRTLQLENQRFKPIPSP